MEISAIMDRFNIAAHLLRCLNSSSHSSLSTNFRRGQTFRLDKRPSSAVMHSYSSNATTVVGCPRSRWTVPDHIVRAVTSVMLALVTETSTDTNSRAASLTTAVEAGWILTHQ